MTKQQLFLIIFLAGLGVSLNLAHAEKADSQKPLSIRAESQTYDGNKKITVYTGSVHMQKGTLDTHAARLEVSDGPHGGKIGTLFGSRDKLVTYRQKRDGGPDLWVEGEAKEIVYDDTLELIKLFNQAKLVLFDGKKRTHESSGIYISYDSYTDVMSVNNTVHGVSVPGAGYTNAVIYPSNKSAPSQFPEPSPAGSKIDSTVEKENGTASSTKKKQQKIQEVSDER